MTIDFYYTFGSPPCSLVSLTCAALGIESHVKIHHVDLLTNEHLKEDFLKINPQHTAPVIIDDGFILSESRSIAKYLVAKYGNKTLYPEDIKIRATIDQRLDFDLGTLYAKFAEYYYPQFIDGTPAEKAKLEKLKDALHVLETYLEGKKYAVGSELTLADLGLAVSVVIFEISGISIKEYPNIISWLALVRSTAPRFEEVMAKYVKEYHEFFDYFSKP